MVGIIRIKEFIIKVYVFRKLDYFQVGGLLENVIVIFKGYLVIFFVQFCILGIYLR